LTFTGQLYEMQDEDYYALHCNEEAALQQAVGTGLFNDNELLPQSPIANDWGIDVHPMQLYINSIFGGYNTFDGMAESPLEALGLNDTSIMKPGGGAAMHDTSIMTDINTPQPAPISVTAAAEVPPPPPPPAPIDDTEVPPPPPPPPAPIDDTEVPPPPPPAPIDDTMAAIIIPPSAKLRKTVNGDKGAGVSTVGVSTVGVPMYSITIGDFKVPVYNKFHTSRDSVDLRTPVLHKSKLVKCPKLVKGPKPVQSKLKGPKTYHSCTKVGCNHSVQSMSNLVKHELYIHQDETQQWVKDAKHAIETMANPAPEDADARFRCTFCDLRFAHRTTLYEHFKLHDKHVNKDALYANATRNSAVERAERVGAADSMETSVQSALLRIREHPGWMK
jgi:hypothetical protein